MVRSVSRICSVIAILLVTAMTIPSYADPAFSTNVPEGIRTQMRQDFAFLSTLNGSRTSELYTEFFGGRTLQGSDLVAFFTKRIARVELGNCGLGPAVACVKYILDPNKMWLTPVFQTINVPQLLRVSVLLHEARHSESDNDNWTHITCPVPFRDEFGRDNVSIFSGAKLEGQPGCDETPMGAYGLQVVLFRNIERACANCNQKLRMDARIFGDDMVKRIINPAAKRSLQDDGNPTH